MLLHGSLQYKQQHATEELQVKMTDLRQVVFRHWLAFLGQEHVMRSFERTEHQSVDTVLYYLTEREGEREHRDSGGRESTHTS